MCFCEGLCGEGGVCLCGCVGVWRGRVCGSVEYMSVSVGVRLFVKARMYVGV